MSRNVEDAAIVEARRLEPGGVPGQPSPVVPERGPAWPRLVSLGVCVVAISVGLVMLRDLGPATHADRVALTTGLLAAVSLAATLTYLAILTVLHVLPTGYNPIRHAVSDYGVGRYRALFTVALYVSSVAVLTLALALVRGVGSPPLPTRDLVYLLVIPFARIGMTVFPTSLEGQRISRTGLIHYAFAVAAFALTYLAISGMTPGLRNLDPSGWARDPLGWTEWVVGPALALVVITMIRPLRRTFGLFERIFLLTTNIWFAVAACLLISRLS